MTRAVCIICGTPKFGAWTRCDNCSFIPLTVVELITAIAYSDNGKYRNQLDQLSAHVRQQLAVLERTTGQPFVIDPELIAQTIKAIQEPSFRDVHTLTRKASTGFFKKQLNHHSIGPDGYQSHVLTRGRDIGWKEFDAIRSTGDGDLYVMVVYENGLPRETAIPKDRWYAIFDLHILADRSVTRRSKLQLFYEEMCRKQVEGHLGMRSE